MDGMQDRMRENDPTLGKCGAMKVLEASDQGFKMTRKVI